MGNGGRYNLRKAGKMGVREEEEEGTGSSSSSDDRLSHLPEPILSHILSFLDTKSAIQTSVLSRAWRSSWKCVPVLDLRRESFRSNAAFERFVHKVLFWRGHLSVRKVCYVDNVLRGKWLDKRDQSLIMRVVKYALSHDVQQLLVEAGNEFTMSTDYHRFSSVFGGSILNTNLKTLELGCIVLDSGFGSSGFQMLTSLNLKNCALHDFDAFSNFPCLKNLVMRSVSPIGRPIRVRGPELLSLELCSMDLFQIEIFAPKLKFFSLRQCAITQGFSKSTLPSLDHADIALTNAWWNLSDPYTERNRQHFHLLFQGLHNAKTLKLDADVIKILQKICMLGEQQPSPFRRLESLIVATDRVPVEVVNYLFKGSSCEEPDILTNLDA